MNPQVVKIDKRTSVRGFWLLPGTRLEFDTIGQANSFIYRNGGALEEAPKPRPKQKDKTSVERVDATTYSGTGKSSGDSDAS